MDGSLLVASLAAGISLVALGVGRYDRWREGKLRHQDLERAERQRREALERAERQRQQDLERSRPGFAIEWNWNAGQSGVWIGLNATALSGRPSTSLIKAGFALRGEVELSNLHGGPDPRHARGHASFPFLKEIIPCEPDRRYPFVLQPLHGLGPFIDAETELVPYVIDVEGTRHEGPSMAGLPSLDGGGLEATRRLGHAQVHGSGIHVAPRARGRGRPF